LDQPGCWIQDVTEALNAWCKKQKVSVLDGEFALIYVNGDHHLENLRREDQSWKVRLTDEEFPNSCGRAASETLGAPLPELLSKKCQLSFSWRA
jgi:hypothetical protein